MIFALLHLQTILPRLEYAQTQLCLERYEWIGIRKVLNSLAENKGKRGENKRGSNIYLHTLTLQMAFSCFHIARFHAMHIKCMYVIKLLIDLENESNGITFFFKILYVQNEFDINSTE